MIHFYFEAAPGRSSNFILQGEDPMLLSKTIVDITWLISAGVSTCRFIIEQGWVPSICC